MHAYGSLMWRCVHSRCFKFTNTAAIFQPETLVVVHVLNGGPANLPEAMQIICIISHH
jgi:hypothetical protein